MTENGKDSGYVSLTTSLDGKSRRGRCGPLFVLTVSQLREWKLEQASALPRDIWDWQADGQLSWMDIPAGPWSEMESCKCVVGWGSPCTEPHKMLPEAKYHVNKRYKRIHRNFASWASRALLAWPGSVLSWSPRHTGCRLPLKLFGKQGVEPWSVSSYFVIICPIFLQRASDLQMAMSFNSAFLSRFSPRTPKSVPLAYLTCMWRD